MGLKYSLGGTNYGDSAWLTTLANNMPLALSSIELSNSALGLAWRTESRKSIPDSASQVALSGIWRSHNERNDKEAEDAGLTLGQHLRFVAVLASDELDRAIATSVSGTLETCPLGLTTSVYRGRPEVAHGRPECRE